MTATGTSVRTPRDPSGIAAAVRAGRCTATDVARGFLERIDAAGAGWFAHVDPERTLAEAAALDTRTDRFALALAGVPVAVEDGIAVAGRPNRHGSAATGHDPARRDDPLVRRLRSAGALVIGTARTAELGAGPDGSPGGRATAAVLHAGLAALGVGVDGDGALRAAAAGNGLVALKPGRRVLPLPGEAGQLWFGLAETTVLASRVSDALALLETLGATPAGGPGRAGGARQGLAVSRLTEPGPAGTAGGPGGTDTLPVAGAVACSMRAGHSGWPDPASCAAVHAAARTLGELGIRVTAAEPPYRPTLPQHGARRRTAGLARQVDELGLDPALLAPAAQAALRRGRRVLRLGGPHPATPTTWRRRVLDWLDAGGHDVALLPSPAAGRRTPTCLNAWNLAGLPALVAPVRWGSGRPAVQLVGRPGAERLLLGTAAVLERGA